MALSYTLAMSAFARRRAFTLVEILVVIAIVALLSAIIFPTFVLVREKARRTSCLSNLKQIGGAMEMYRADYDGRFPFAVDPYDKKHGGFGAGFDALIPTLPMVHEVLLPYSSPQVFGCAGDTGFEFDEQSGVRMDALPSAYEKFGTSYYYRTELASLQIQEFSLRDPVKLNLMFDAHGKWHAGGLLRREQRYNTLFADGHAKSLSGVQFDQAWATPAR